MRAISIIMGLIFGITSLTMAQEADSIVVTYDNQRTIIQVPAFGKQTTIKMADTVQVIEIGVSRRKINDISQKAQYPSNNVITEKPSKKTKWYSQVEAGYTINFVPGPSSEHTIINSEPATLSYNKDNLQGYKLEISVFERERSITSRFSYVSGFKLGFSQSFRKLKNTPVIYDTIPRTYYVGYNPISISRLQFLFPFGFRQYIGSGKSNARINFGSNIGSSIDLIKDRWDSNNIQFSGSPLILQPFLGLEIRKFGLLTTMDLSFGSEYDVSSRGSKLSVDYGVGFSLTYRLF
jgi:hypothetical protein